MTRLVPIGLAAASVAFVFAELGTGRLLQARVAVGEGLAALRAAAEPPLPNRPYFPVQSRLAGLAEYVTACTQVDDRVLLMWFAPEVYFFSQRGFAGGMVAFLGNHWSSDVDQRRTIEQIESQSVPLVVLQTEAGRIETIFPRLASYLNEHYRDGGSTSFGDPRSQPDAYRVLIKRELGDVPADSRWGVPCPSLAVLP